MLSTIVPIWKYFGLRIDSGRFIKCFGSSTAPARVSSTEACVRRGGGRTVPHLHQLERRLHLGRHVGGGHVEPLLPGRVVRGALALLPGQHLRQDAVILALFILATVSQYVLCHAILRDMLVVICTLV